MKCNISVLSFIFKQATTFPCQITWSSWKCTYYPGTGTCTKISNTFLWFLSFYPQVQLQYEVKRVTVFQAYLGTVVRSVLSNQIKMHVHQPKWNTLNKFYQNIQIPLTCTYMCRDTVFRLPQKELSSVSQWQWLISCGNHWVPINWSVVMLMLTSSYW